MTGCGMTVPNAFDSGNSEDMHEQYWRGHKSQFLFKNVTKVGSAAKPNAKWKKVIVNSSKLIPQFQVGLHFLLQKPHSVFSRYLKLNWDIFLMYRNQSKGKQPKIQCRKLFVYMTSIELVS